MAVENKYFMHRIKLTSGTYDKGIEVKNTEEDAQQSFHAYLGAWAYGHDQNTDYVACEITCVDGSIDNKYKESWTRVEPEEAIVIEHTDGEE